MKKIIMGSVIFFTGFISAILLTHGSLQAEDNINSEVMSKLNDITRGQQEIVAAINSMKEDIQLIKVRITQMQ